MEILWDNKNLAAALNLDIENKIINITSVEFDSREVKPGSLFMALRSKEFISLDADNGDGHLYIEDALKRGAELVIAEYIPEGVDRNKILQVPNSKQALLNLAQYKRKHVAAKYIAITGSLGKTSTKEMVASCFAALGKTHKNYGNFNNELGLPVTLARMPENTQYAILELGMNHIGELKNLSLFASPDIAVITTVEAVHLQFFDSIEDIAHAKSEIFTGLSHDGIVVINCDNPYYELMYNHAKEQHIDDIISFGKTGGDAQLIEYSITDQGAHIKAKINQQLIEYKIPLSGEHQAINSLIPLLIVSKLGLNVAKAAQALNDMEIIYGRGQIHQVNFRNHNITIFDESYNASPAAVKAAIKNVGTRFNNNRKIAILADMKELGPRASEFHESLAPILKENNFEVIICVGELMKYLYDLLPSSAQKLYFHNYQELLKSDFNFINDQDVILVKGSLSTKMGEVVKYLKGKN